MRRSLALGILSSVFLAVSAFGATYNIDPYHSSVTFRIKHVVGKVTGHFDKFSGSFDYDAANPKVWKAQASIDANSINTGIEKRDNHLRSPEFFDVQKFPTIAFKSTGVTDVNGDKAKLQGNLTMHGITRPVVLDLEIGGVAKDPMGKGNRAGVTASTTVDRSDYNIGPKSGPLASMVGDKVEIVIDVEAVSQ